MNRSLASFDAETAMANDDALEARAAALAAPAPDGLLSDAVRIRDAAVAAFRAGDLPRLRQAVLDVEALRATVAA